MIGNVCHCALQPPCPQLQPRMRRPPHHMECNLIADHLALTTTHQCGCNVVPHRQYKDKQPAGTNAGNGTGPENPEKRNKGIGTQRLRSPKFVKRYSFHDTVHRQHHEGQKNLRHCDQSAPQIENHLNTSLLRNYSQPNHNIVQDTLGLQQHYP